MSTGLRLGSALRPQTVNPRDLVFVPVAASDAEDLASLRVEAMRESLERIGRFDPVRARQRFLSSFLAEHTRAIVLEGQTVGFFVVRPEPVLNFVFEA